MTDSGRSYGLTEAFRGFGFRLVSPDTAAGKDLRAFHVARSDGSVATLLDAWWCPLDPWVVDFGAEDGLLRPLLAPLLTIPRMGRLAFAGILNTIVRRMNPEHAFVNVGVWHGFSLLAAMAGNDDKVCVGIDNFSEFGGPRDEFLRRFLDRRSPRHRFYNQDYEDFFAAGLDRPVGSYFYDGAHDYEHQYRGLMAAEPLYAEGAVIVVDDINWAAPREATLQFAGDSRLEWTVVIDQTSASDNHPALWNGTMVLQAGVGRTSPLRLRTRHELMTVPDSHSPVGTSLSVIVVGERAEFSELNELEVVRASKPESIPAAVETSTGTYLAVLHDTARVSADELRQRSPNIARGSQILGRRLPYRLNPIPLPVTTWAYPSSHVRGGVCAPQPPLESPPWRRGAHGGHRSTAGSNFPPTTQTPTSNQPNISRYTRISSVSSAHGALCS
jgi:hypothetical protein